MSEPASASLAPLAPTSVPSQRAGRNRRFCSVEPWSRIGIATVQSAALMAKISPLSLQPYPSPSGTRRWSRRVLAPGPRIRREWAAPGSRTARSVAILLAQNSPRSSRSRRLSFSSARANRNARSCQSCCSSLNAKSIVNRLLATPRQVANSTGSNRNVTSPRRHVNPATDRVGRGKRNRDDH